MSNVKVAVRTRPLSKKEVDQGAKFIVDVNGDTLSLINTKVESLSEYGDSRERVKHFTFDYCYNSYDQPQSPVYASQELLFQDLGTEVLEAAFEGYNACVVAYGQTSTGKTYTMMGHHGEVGLIPRICEGLFARVDDYEANEITFRVDISYLEIYNERVRDMLNCKDNERYTLKVREHPKEGPYVQDLSRHLVKDNTEIQTLLEKGNDLRVTAATHMHDHSSRSHAIITITFTQASLVDDLPSEIISKINLVDLAGSERADTTVKTGYKGRLKEGANINKSLVTLGNVIKSLAEKSLLSWSTESMSSLHNSSASETMSSPHASPRKQRSFYIPYRDSVLTWLLKDSLGGNSKTIMIATITPASSYYSESLSTLRYAQRAKSIINKPKINEDPNVTIIREMKREIERLRQMLATAQMTSSQQNEIVFIVPIKRKKHESESDKQAGPLMSLQESGTNTFLFERIQENEDKANQLTKTWLDKWQETQDILDESDLSIRRPLGRRASSQGVIVDSQLPHLIGMDDDILSTGVIIYHLKEGKTRIGREDASQEQDIGLCGPCIQREHCIIKNVLGTVTLYPNRGALCAVNGIDLKEPQRLTQGDVILLGKTHMFRFNHPEEAAKLREHRRAQSVSDASSTREVGMDGASSPNLMLPAEVTSPTATSRPQMRMFTASPSSSTSDIWRELEEVREAQRQTEATYHEKEDKVFRVHEEHRAEIEHQKAKLALLIEEAQADRVRAEEEMIAARQRLEDEREEHAKMLAIELTKLAEIREKQKPQHGAGDKSGSDLEEKDDEAETDVPGDLDSSPVCQKGKGLRVRKTSIEGKIKDLAQIEMMQKWSQRETEVGLARQEEELEDQFEHTQKQILLHQQKIEEIEDRYKATDASHYEEIAAQVRELNALQRKEEQLEMYLEEKQDLLKVEEFKPQPLRGACSAELLTEVETAEIFAQKFSGRRGSDGDLPARGYMFAADSSCSLNTTSKESSDGSHSLHNAPSTSNMSLDSLSEALSADKSKDSGSKKISSRAQRVTDRLYKAPTNKPRKQVTKESQPSRSDDRANKSSNSGSRHLRNKKPPVEKYNVSKQKSGPKDHHVQQKVNQHKKGTNTQSSEKSTQPKSSFSPKKVMKSLPGVTKKGIPVKAFEAFSPSAGTDKSRSLSESGVAYRAPFRPGFRLRQVSSASSLASVPEDEREETELDDTVTQSETDIMSAVVLRKRSRRLSRDEEYKRHSAPVGDKLASYSKIMTPGLSLQQSKMGLAGNDHDKHFVTRKRPSDFVWTSHVKSGSPHNVSDPDMNKYTSSSASRSESEEEFFSAGGSSGSIPLIVITDNSDSEVRLSTSPECTFQDSAQMESAELDNTDVSMNSSMVTIASTVIENPDYLSCSDDSISASDHSASAVEPKVNETAVRAGSKREHVHIPDKQQQIEVKRQKQSSASENTRTPGQPRALQVGVTDPMLDHSSPAVEDLSFSGDSLEGLESDQQPSPYTEDLEEANFEDSLELLRQHGSSVEMMEASSSVVLPSETSLQPAQSSLETLETKVDHAHSSTEQVLCTETVKPEQEDNSNSDFSIDSIQDAKEKLETLQEVLQQLKPKSSSKSSSGSSGRRTRQRAHFRHHTSLESDCSEHFSDDSLGSEPCSKPSSRPGSASKRRRRPQIKAQDTPVKKSKAMSSEEYVTSDTDGVYSDDSLTCSDNRILSNPDMSIANTSESAAQEIATIADSIQHLSQALNSSRSSVERSDDLADSVHKSETNLPGSVLPPMTSWSSSPEIHSPPLRDTRSVRGRSEPPGGQSSLLKSKLSRLSRSVTNVMTFDGRADDHDGINKAPEDRKYNFVIHKDELNVVYNVQRTEYNTAGLRPVEYTVPRKAIVYTVENSLQDFPESIDITLTETSRTQREEKIHTTHTEQVVFKMPDDYTSNDAHVTEHGYLSSYNSQYSQVSNGENSRESSVEKTIKDENTNSYIKCDRSSEEVDATEDTENEPPSASLSKSVKPSVECLSRDTSAGNKKQDSGHGKHSAEVSGTSTPDIIQGHASLHGLNSGYSEKEDMDVTLTSNAKHALLPGMTMSMLLGESDPEDSAHIKSLVEFVNMLPEPDVIVNQVEDAHQSPDDTKSCDLQLYLPVLIADDPCENTSGGTEDLAKAKKLEIYVGGVNPTKTSSGSLPLDQLVQGGKQILIPVSASLLKTSLSTDHVGPVLQSLCHAAIGATSSPATAGNNSLQLTPSIKHSGLTVNEKITRQLQWTQCKPDCTEETSAVPSVNHVKDYDIASVGFHLNTDVSDSNGKKNVSPSVVVVNGQTYLNFRSRDGSHVKQVDDTGAVLQTASTELHKTLENMVKALKAAENLAFKLPEKTSRYSERSLDSAPTQQIFLSDQADAKNKENPVCIAESSGDVIDSSAERSCKRLTDGTAALENQMENIFGSQLVYIDGLPYIQIERVEGVPERACFQPKAEVRVSEVHNSEQHTIENSPSSTCVSFAEPPTENSVVHTGTYNQAEDPLTVVMQDEDISMPSTRTYGKGEELSADTDLLASKIDSAQHRAGDEAKQCENVNKAEAKIPKDTCQQPKVESKPIEIIVKDKDDSQFSVGSSVSERKKDVVLKMKGNDDIVLTTEVPIATSVDHQLVRRELEKRIAKLEKHVGRVSDSAISSDYTDGETTALSPKSSRMFDTEKNMTSLKKVLFPHKLANLSVPDTYSVQVGLEGTTEAPPKNPSRCPESEASECRSQEAEGLNPPKSGQNSEDVEADADYLVSFKDRARGPLSPSTPDSALGSSVFQSEESSSSNLGSTLSASDRLFHSQPIPSDESMPPGNPEESRESKAQLKDTTLERKIPVQIVGLQPMFQAQFHPCQTDQSQALDTETHSRVVKGAGDQQEGSNGANFEPSRNNHSVQNNLVSSGDSGRKKERSSGVKKAEYVKQRFTGPHRQKDAYIKSMRDTPTSDDKVGSRRSRQKSYLGVETDSICNLPKDWGIPNSWEMDEDYGELSISGVNSCSTFIPDSDSKSKGQLTMNRLFTVFSSAEEASHSSESDEDRDVESSGTYQAFPRQRSERISSDKCMNTAPSVSAGNPVSDGSYLMKEHVGRQKNEVNKSDLSDMTQANESRHDATTGQYFPITPENSSVLRSLQSFMEQGDKALLSDIETTQKTESFVQSSLQSTSTPVNIYQELRSSNIRCHGMEGQRIEDRSTTGLESYDRTREQRNEDISTRLNSYDRTREQRNEGRSTPGLNSYDCTREQRNEDGSTTRLNNCDRTREQRNEDRSTAGLKSYDRTKEQRNDNGSTTGLNNYDRTREQRNEDRSTTGLNSYDRTREQRNEDRSTTGLNSYDRTREQRNEGRSTTGLNGYDRTREQRNEDRSTTGLNSYDRTREQRNEDRSTAELNSYDRTREERNADRSTTKLNSYDHTREQRNEDRSTAGLNSYDRTREQRNEDRSTTGFTSSDNQRKGSILQSLREFMDSGGKSQLSDIKDSESATQTPLKRKGIIRVQVETETIQSRVGLEQPANDSRVSYQIHALGIPGAPVQYIQENHKDIVDASEAQGRTDHDASGSFSAERNEITHGARLSRDMQHVPQSSWNVGFSSRTPYSSGNVSSGSRVLTEQQVRQSHGLNSSTGSMQHKPQSSLGVGGYTLQTPKRTMNVNSFSKHSTEQLVTHGLNLPQDSSQHVQQSSPDTAEYTSSTPYRGVNGNIGSRNPTEQQDDLTHGIRSSSGSTYVPQTSQIPYSTSDSRSSSMNSAEQQHGISWLQGCTQYVPESTFCITEELPSLPFTTVDVARSPWVSAEQQNHPGQDISLAGSSSQVKSGSVRGTTELLFKTVDVSTGPYFSAEQHLYQPLQGISENYQKLSQSSQDMTYNNLSCNKDSHKEAKPVTLTQPGLNEARGVDNKPVATQHNTCSSRSSKMAQGRRPGESSYRKAVNYDSSSSDSEVENVRFQQPGHQFSYHDSDSDPDLDRVDQAIKIAMILAGNEYAGRQSSNLIRMTSPRLLQSPPTGLLQLIPLFDVRCQQNHSPPLPLSNYLSEDENTVKPIPVSQVFNDQHLDQDWILKHRSEGDLEPWQTNSSQVLSQKVNGRVSVNSVFPLSAEKDFDTEVHQPLVTNTTAILALKQDPFSVSDTMNHGQAHDADWINRNRSQADIPDSWNTTSSQPVSQTVFGKTGVSINETGRFLEAQKIHEGRDVPNSSSHSETFGTSVSNPQGISRQVPGYSFQQEINNSPTDNDFEGRKRQFTVQNMGTVREQKEYPQSRPDTRYKDQIKDADWINQNRSQAQIPDSWNTVSSWPISQTVFGKSGVNVGSTGHFLAEQNLQNEENAQSSSTKYSQGTEAYPSLKPDAYVDERSEDLFDNSKIVQGAEHYNHMDTRKGLPISDSTHLRAPHDISEGIFVPNHSLQGIQEPHSEQGPLRRLHNLPDGQVEDVDWINRPEGRVQDSWVTGSSQPISQTVLGRTGVELCSDDPHSSSKHFLQDGEKLHPVKDRGLQDENTGFGPSQQGPDKEPNWMDSSNNRDCVQECMSVHHSPTDIPGDWTTSSSQLVSQKVVGRTGVVPDSSDLNSDMEGVPVTDNTTARLSSADKRDPSVANGWDDLQMTLDTLPGTQKMQPMTDKGLQENTGSQQGSDKDQYQTDSSNHQDSDQEWISRHRAPTHFPDDWTTLSSQLLSQKVLGRTGVVLDSSDIDSDVEGVPVIENTTAKVPSAAKEDHSVGNRFDHVLDSLPGTRKTSPMKGKGKHENTGSQPSDQGSDKDQYQTDSSNHQDSDQEWISRHRAPTHFPDDWTTLSSQLLSQKVLGRTGVVLDSSDIDSDVEGVPVIENTIAKVPSAAKEDHSVDNRFDHDLDSLPGTRKTSPMKGKGKHENTGSQPSDQGSDKDQYQTDSSNHQDSDQEWISRHRAPTHFPDDWTTLSSQLLSQKVLGRTGVVPDSSDKDSDVEGFPAIDNTTGRASGGLPITRQMLPLKEKEPQGEKSRFDPSGQVPDKDQYQTDSSNHQNSDQEWVSRNRAMQGFPEDWTTSSSLLLSQNVQGRTGVRPDSSDIDSDLERVPATVSTNYQITGHNDSVSPGPRISSALEDGLTDSDTQEKDSDWITRNRRSGNSAEPWVTHSSQLMGQDVTGRTGIVPEVNECDEDTLQEQKKPQLKTKNTGVETPASTSSDEGIGKSCQLLDHNWILNNRQLGEFSPTWRADSSLMSPCVNQVVIKQSLVDDMVKPENVMELELSPRETKADSLAESNSTLDLDGQLSDQDWVNRNRKQPEFPDNWVTHSSQLFDKSMVGRTGVTVEPDSDSSVDENLSHRVRGRSLSVATSDTNRHVVSLPERSQSVDDGNYMKDSDGRVLSNDSITWVFIGPAEQHNRSVQTEGSYHDDSETVSADDESESGDPPLQHKYGIDDSMLPLSERTVSDDNLPKYSREDVRRPHSSCGVLRNTTKSPSPEIDDIFPSKHPEEDGSPTTGEQLSYNTTTGDNGIRVVTRGVSPSKLSKSGRRNSAFLMEDIPAVTESVVSEHITPSYQEDQNSSNSVAAFATLPKVDRSTSTRRKKTKLISRGVQSESFEEDCKENSPVKEYTISDTQTEDSNWMGMSDIMLENNSLLRKISDRIPEHETTITPTNAAQIESLPKTVKIKDTSMQTSGTEDDTEKVDLMVSSGDSTLQTVSNESTQTDTVVSVLSGTQTTAAEIASTAVQTHAEAGREPEQSKLDTTIDMSVQTDEGVDLFSPNSSFNLTSSLLSSEFIVDNIPDLDISTDIQSLRDEHDRMMSLLRRARSAREAREEALRKRSARTPLPFLEEEQPSSRVSPSPPSSMDTPMQLPAIPTFSPTTPVSQTRASPTQAATSKPRHINVINTVDRDRELKLVLNLGSGEPGAPIASIVLKDNSSEAPSVVEDSSQGLEATRVCRDKTSTTTTSVTTDGKSTDEISEINVVSREGGRRPAVNERTIPIRIQHVEATFPSPGRSPQGQNSPSPLSHKDNLDTTRTSETPPRRPDNGRPDDEETSDPVLNKNLDHEGPNIGQQSSEVNLLDQRDTAVEANSYSEQSKNSRNEQYHSQSFAHTQGITTSSGHSPQDDSNQSEARDQSKDRSISSVNKSVRHILNSSDEFTQTDFDFLHNCKDRKPTSGTRHSKSLGSSETDPVSMQDELERLQQERVEILELLSLNYLPSSLTIELLEAKLNYCIGQTDLILSSIEDTWDADGGDGATVEDSEKLQQNVITEDYILRYKEELAQSKKTIASCMDKMERAQGRGRGRGRTRTRNRDIMNMRRKAEIEAFKLERMREQNEFGRTRSLSPLKHSQMKCHANTTHQSTDLELTAASSESSLIMSPRDHKDYLVTLRKQLVRAVAEDELERQERSFSSDAYWTPRSLNSSFRSISSGADYSSSREVSPEFRMSEYLYNFDGTSAWHGLPASARSNREMFATTNSVMRQRAESKMLEHQHQHLALDSEKLLEEYQETRQRASTEISQARETLKPRARPPSSHSTRSTSQSAPSHIIHQIEKSGPLSISTNAVDEELEKMRQAYNQQSSPTLRYLHRRDTASLTRRGSSLPGRTSQLSSRPLSADHSYSHRGQSYSSAGAPCQSSYHSYTDYTKSVLSRSERNLHHLSSGSTSIPKRSTFDTRKTSQTRRPRSATTATSAAPFGVSKPSPRSQPDSARLTYRSSSSVSETERNRYTRTRPISSADIKSKIQSKVKSSKH